MRKQQAGFTLIELVMVIVILGILAATAMPKFVNMGGDARKAVMQGVEGAMRGTNAIIYARAASEQKQSAATETISLNSATINIVYGFAKDTADLQNAMDLSPAADFTIGTGIIAHAKAADGTKCQIGYAAATSANDTPDYTPTLTDCN